MPHKLLLADDSVTIQRVIELTFAAEDVQVVTVGDGEEAIARIQTDRPDIVLADIGMPKRNGYEVAAFIKNDASLRHIPVLLLTGAFEPVDDDRVRDAGCEGVLVKPFEPQQVIARVRELLRGATGSPTIATAGVPRPVEHLASPRPTQEPPPSLVQTPVVIRAAAAGPVLPPMSPALRLVTAAPKLASPAPAKPRSGPSSALEDYFDQLDAAFAARAAGTDPPAVISPSREALAGFQPAPSPPMQPAPVPAPAEVVVPPRMMAPPSTPVEPPPPPAPAPAPTAVEEPAPPPVVATPLPPVTPPPPPSPVTPAPSAPPPAVTAPPPPPPPPVIPAPSAPPPAATAPPPPPSVIPAPSDPAPPAALAPSQPAVAVPPAPVAAEPPRRSEGGEQWSTAIADAFSALLEAEQTEPEVPVRLPPAPITEEALDALVTRVAARLGPNVVREVVKEVVSDIAERLIREEIQRIRSKTP